MNIKKINYTSKTFNALKNNDIEYIKTYWHEYEDCKDDWLHVASCYSNLEINKLFIHNGADPLDNKNENFFNAIYQNNLELVQYYVALNCFSFIKDGFFGGPLSNAFENDNVDLVKFLLELGCDIHLDNDYAFNRGLAYNSKKCISYILNNHKQYPVKYNPFEEYNHQEMIKNNYYELCNFILDHLTHPLTFNFDNYLPLLLSCGKPEMFDVFSHHGLINKEKFIIYYPNLLYYFSEQSDLYQHLKENYRDWLISAENITIQKETEKNFTISLKNDFLKERNIDTEIQKIISFQFNHPNPKNPITLKKFQQLLEIPLFDAIKDNHLFFVHHCLDNLHKANNLYILQKYFSINMLSHEKISEKIVNKIKTYIDEPFFNEFMYTIFKEYKNMQHPELDKFFLYFKEKNKTNKVNLKNFKQLKI